MLSGLTTNLDDVLAALQGSGITQANFTGITTGTPQFVTGIAVPRPTINWTFVLAAPLSKIKETVATLTTLQENIHKQNKDLILNFTVQGTQVSQQAQQSQPCSIPDLLADARAQAQKLTNASGFTLDTILAMSSATATAAPGPVGVSGILLPSSAAVPADGEVRAAAVSIAMRHPWLILLLAAAPAFAQLESDTVSVTATRLIVLQPDQIVFFVNAVSGPERDLDQVLAALPGTGITAASLESVQSDVEGRLQWSFTLPVPFAKVSSTVTTLTGLRDGVRGVINNVSFGVQGTQVSEQARQAQSCKEADLIADAQAQAQKLADAAGFSVGPMLSLTDGSGSQTPGAVVRASIPVLIPVTGFLLLLQQPPPPLNCTATVKFRLLRFH